MAIFSGNERTSLATKRETEPNFAYLDRSARPVMQRVREVLEDWLARYPAEAIPELLARLRSGNDVHFASATFELYLHELMTRLGCMLAVHPDVAGGVQTHPDFLVTPPGEDPFYLEAIVASGDSEDDRKADNRLAAVLDALRDMSGSDFYLSLARVGPPPQSVKTRKMVGELQAWLATLNADQVEQQLEAEQKVAAPRYVYQEGDWKLRFEAYPKSANRRGQPDSPNIGVVSTAVENVEAWKAIYKAVRKKATRYGTLDRPFLVAINAGAFHLGTRDVMDGLFGQEQILIRGQQVEARREKNGAWHGPQGPQNTRVSGVLVVPGWSIFHAAMRDACVFHNPWAERPLSAYLDRLPHARASGDVMQLHKGLHPGEILELDQSWPGDD